MQVVAYQLPGLNIDNGGRMGWPTELVSLFTEFSAHIMDNHSAENLDVTNSKRVTQYRLPDL
jgi:hypothetical protein